MFFLYDEIGSHGLTQAYCDELREAGVRVSAFNTTQGRRNRFQLNFRNHRKIVVVDGVEAWVGGHNVGDDYLSLHPETAPWRDTHLRLAGPGGAPRPDHLRRGLVLGHPRDALAVVGAEGRR